MKNFLEKTLKDMFMVNDYDNGVCVINSNLFSPKDDDDYAIGVKKSNDKYILSDMALTYNRLEQRNGLLNDNISSKVDRIIKEYNLHCDKDTHELMLFASEEDFLMAYSNLLQALIVLNNLDI